MRLADVIDAYLTRQRSLGMRFDSAGQLLHRLRRPFARRRPNPQGDRRSPGTPQHVDIDNYVATQGKGRWTRVSTANMVSALRAFLRYAAREGWCSNRLAESISRPRLYQQESLPYAPDWSAVQQMLADVDTDQPRDIRDRAILLLLALYGMRSGEVAALRLDQIDWAGRTLKLVRLKRRQPQIYPLLPAVAEALARYIDTVRVDAGCQPAKAEEA